MTNPSIHWSLTDLQARFLAIRERIQTHARIYFRHIRCWSRRADLIAEVLGLSWKWFKRLAQKGKDATGFASVLAGFAARAVKHGRRIAGQVKARDVMNERAQQRHGFCVGKLPDISTLTDNPLQEALIDNTRSPILEQVQFRLDFPAWLRTRTERDRRLINDMALGESTSILASRYGLTASRVSQLRRAYHDDWQGFCDELNSTKQGPLSPPTPHRTKERR